MTRPDPTPPVVMVVGGSDSGAGAGIQADLKAVSAHRAYAATVITAVTAQNTLGVHRVHPVPPPDVGAQLDALLSDLAPAAVKTGYLGQVEVLEVVADTLERARANHVVVDPVLVATDGATIVGTELVRAYRALLALGALATPNFREAALLAGMAVSDLATQRAAAETLAEQIGRPVLVTGGHLPGATVADVLVTASSTIVLESARVRSRHVHGTGCSLASAIAARLAHGDDLTRAVDTARTWVRRAIVGAADWHIGAGQGPIDPFGWGQEDTP